MDEPVGRPRLSRVPFALALLGWCVPAIVPSASLTAQTGLIPVRTVTVAASTDSETLRSVYDLRARPDGSILVADTSANALKLFDVSLKSYRTVGDATLQGGIGGLISFSRNSTAVVDVAPKAKNGAARVERAVVNR